LIEGRVARRASLSYFRIGALRVPISYVDRIFSPWRYAYMNTVQEGTKVECLFCSKLAEGDDRRALIVHRAQHCFIMLNAFPYTNGHLMVVPYAHVDELQKLPAAAAHDLIDLTQRMEGVLRRVYRPDGVNLGMNIGRAAGAGVASHVHMHVLPRWFGDANFMSVIGETRVLPEALDTTYERIQTELAKTQWL
jgi:ATP adenylyltransferase